jgi:hypothetical protein
MNDLLKSRVKESYRRGQRVRQIYKPGIFYAPFDNCWYVFGCAAAPRKYVFLSWAMCDAMLRYECLFNTRNVTA